MAWAVPTHLEKMKQEVGAEGQDLTALVNNLRGQGVNVRNGLQAKYIPATNTIVYGPNTKNGNF